MTEKDLEFEKYFQSKMQENQNTLANLHYSTEELREIYKQEYNFRKNMPQLDLQMEPQNLTYEVAEYYLPERWEMPHKGKLLYSDEELRNVLKLIVFNVGVKKALDAIPRTLIEQYLRE